MRPIHRLGFHTAPTSDTGVTLIDRYLDIEIHAGAGSWDTASEETGLTDIQVTLVDTTLATGDITAPEGGSIVWHALWVREESGGSVTIASESTGEHAWTIAPGDSVSIPPGASLRASSGQLALAISIPSHADPLTAPTHGTERYFGYNRQTVAIRVGDVRICRWKLTQPLALAEHHSGPVLVMALARSSVVRTATVIERLAQGDLAVIDLGTNPVITPDGLAYLLTLDRDEP